MWSHQHAAAVPWLTWQRLRTQTGHALRLRHQKLLAPSVHAGMFILQLTHRCVCSCRRKGSFSRAAVPDLERVSEASHSFTHSRQGSMSHAGR
jgi:hypothetical protein